MKDTVKVVTTWSDAGYEEYGQYWCKAVKNYLPSEWKVKVYGTQQDFNFEWYDWDQTFPKWKIYQRKIVDEWWKVRDPNNGKFQGWIDHVLKFSHKGMVIAKELQKLDTRYMIWLDGDAILHSTVPSDWHLQLLNNCAISTQFEYSFKHEDAKWVHIESGIVVYDLQHPQIQSFIERFVEYYNNPDKLVTIRKPYDTYVAVAAMKETGISVNDLNLTKQRITGDKDSTFTNPLLKNYVTHWITKSKSLLSNT